MTLLIVEDDQNKLSKISGFVQSIVPDAEIGQCRSYQSGLKQVIDRKPDIVILDMTMPTYDVVGTEKGGRTRPYAGREILYEMKRRQIKSKVIIVTAFESFGDGSHKLTLQELDTQLKQEFKNNFVCTVFFQLDVKWEETLLRALKECAGQS